MFVYLLLRNESLDPHGKAARDFRCSRLALRLALWATAADIRFSRTNIKTFVAP